MKTLFTKFYNWLYDLGNALAVNTKVKPNYLLIKINQKRFF